MTITCPRCGTLYRSPPRHELEADASFRCVRCRHVFEAAGEEAAEDEDAETEGEFILGDAEGDETGAEDEDMGETRPSRRGRENGNVILERAPQAEATPARFALRSLLV